MQPARLLLFLILILGAQVVLAQGDTITRNPAAVQLKRIWTLEGDVLEARIGSGVGSIGDINGDGLADFAVLSSIPWQWQVFYGSATEISTTPVWTFDSCVAEPDHPIAGDFYGSGHTAVGFMRRIFVAPFGNPRYRLYIFRSDSNRLETEPSDVWYAANWRDTTQPATVSDALAVDLDGDGDDELICVMASVYGDRHGELWIYDGGPGFQVDTPSVVIRDPELNYYYRAYAEDIDGDKHVDLMTVTQTQQQQGNSYSFYWGTGTLPSNNKQPDRQLISPEFSKFIEWVDCDGDGVQDLVAPGILIWRSGDGKNARERPWDRADADIYLKSAGGQLNSGQQPGYLNSKRYEMVGGLWAPGQILFSGSPSGPDLAYDARYYPGADGLQALIPIRGPVGDVNGDGWDDAISGNRAYPSDRFNRGIAVILAGGPYIPTDDPSVGVRQLTLENRRDALSLWPNPVREELNIAWRGDLQRMPRRFEVHDMSGRLVASGSVPEGDGAAVWRCDQQPAGSYLVSILDAAGVLLVSAPIVKQ